MKRYLTIILIGVICVFLFGCGAKKKYKIDFQGQEGCFKGAKESYAEGELVHLSYDLIATDTDYTFFVDGEAYAAKWNEKEGYIIEFKMPSRDVIVNCESHNSMVFEE